MSTSLPLETHFAQTWPPAAWADVTVLLAVSGGADSVALLRAVHRHKIGGEGRLVVAHFNHHLRGAESNQDEAFVIELCQALGVPCEVGRPVGGPLDQGAGHGIEAAARVARYGYFQSTAARVGARYVVTAHTADDQAETILHRILRGTGIAGLSGMARTRPLGPAATLIRPLLGVRRADLVAYLGALGQPFRHDSSNRDTRHTRNRIRSELLPQLACQYNPGVVEALLRLGHLAGELQGVVAGLVDDLASRACIRQRHEDVRIALAPLAGQPRYVVRELLVTVWRREGWPLQAMGFDQWDLLATMLLSRPDGPSAPAKRMFPGGVLVEVGDGVAGLRRAVGSELE